MPSLPESDASPAPYFAPQHKVDFSAYLDSGALAAARMTAERHRRDKPGLGYTNPSPIQEAFQAVVHLRPRPASDMWRDESHIRLPERLPGSMCVFDRREKWVTHLKDPFDTVNVTMPLQALNELADELRMPRIEGLQSVIGEPCRDAVFLHLAQALFPAFEHPAEASSLYVEHVFAAMRLHLALTYGGLRPAVPRHQGGLAPWQIRRVKEILLDDLREDHSLSALAAACGLSVGHFGRAFKRSMGLPPHQWLLERKVERACQLLAGTSMSLIEIADACGFADQSHMTRVFVRRSGITPGSWRRQFKA